MATDLGRVVAHFVLGRFQKIEEWEQMVDVNIKGVLYGIAAARPRNKPEMLQGALFSYLEAL